MNVKSRALPWVGLLPLPTGHTTGASFDSESCGIVSSWKQFLERPTERFVRVSLRAHQCRGLSGHKRYLELVQRQRKTFPSRLDVGLLASPTEKEGAPSELRWKRTKCRDLRAREESLGDLFYLQPVSYQLQVDSDLAGAGYDVEGRSVRVRDVEADRLSARLGDQGG